MTEIKASQENNGSKKQLSANEYIAVSDLMDILSDLSNGKTRPLLPPEPKAIQGSRGSLASLPPKAPPPPITPSPDLSPSSRGAALDVETTALSTTQPEEKTISELARELWELKLVALSDNDYYNRQLGRLKNRFLWLAGLSVGTIVTLGIVLGWLGANLKQTQTQLANYEGGVEINRARLDRLEGNALESIETSLRSLQAQIPETLETDLETTQEDITALKVQLREMELKLAAHDKALSVLVSALQGVVR
ncbi:hypothetical protein [Spirulina sp. 06S082]|uniref:hypothetical protein n=1 Tax=Spirulina sp. 06S082 TaxID=3110248 RepID=UPI002B219F72|nr:hypothetical protein [Spirulina sp. 06S082]MEA5470254.1 hypothetical protein [Spirulina sp. 06S082]